MRCAGLTEVPSWERRAAAPSEFRGPVILLAQPTADPTLRQDVELSWLQMRILNQQLERVPVAKRSPAQELGGSILAIFSPGGRFPRVVARV